MDEEAQLALLAAVRTSEIFFHDPQSPGAENEPCPCGHDERPINEYDLYFL
jgi:hypothetical protein